MRTGSVTATAPARCCAGSDALLCLHKGLVSGESGREREWECEFDTGRWRIA